MFVPKVALNSNVNLIQMINKSQKNQICDQNSQTQKNAISNVYYASNVAMYPNSYTLGLTYDFEILLDQFRNIMED